MSTKQERRRLNQMVRIAARAERARKRAHRRIATRAPQPAKVWLIDAGISLAFADRYASAFSRGMTPDRVATTKIKPKTNSRKSERVVPVNEYNARAFLRRLFDYRPRNNPEAAAEFQRVAALYS